MCPSGYDRLFERNVTGCGTGKAKAGAGLTFPAAVWSDFGRTDGLRREQTLMSVFRKMESLSNIDASEVAIVKTKDMMVAAERSKRRANAQAGAQPTSCARMAHVERSGRSTAPARLSRSSTSVTLSRVL